MVKLTKEEFKLMEKTPISSRAKASYINGRKLLVEYLKNGFVRINKGNSNV